MNLAEDHRHSDTLFRVDKNELLRTFEGEESLFQDKVNILIQSQFHRKNNFSRLKLRIKEQPLAMIHWIFFYHTLGALFF